MIKWTIPIITMLMFVLVVNAKVCEDKLTPGQSCTMITPTITCQIYNYTIYNETGNIVKQDTLTLLNGTIYYFIFNETSGSYTTELCEGSTREILVEGDDPMASMAIVGFLALLISGLFILPFKINFSDRLILNQTLKYGCWILALLLISLSTAMVSTIASNAGIQVTQELFTILFIINWSIYVFMAFMVLKFFFDAIKQWKIKKMEERS